MATKYDPSGIEAEFEPGSRGRVLRNKLGIRSVREMAEAESEALLLAQRMAIEQTGENQRFSAVDICALHRLWLGPIYEWAGEYRSVNISKGGFPFASALQIARLMSELERGALADFTPCHPGDADAVARAIAVVHAELVLIHPFREGNGRVARLFALLMALQAGLPPLDFSVLEGRGKRNYIAAIHAAVGRNYKPLAAQFERVIDRTLKRYAASSAP